jgi:hypothetical protein
MGVFERPDRPKKQKVKVMANTKPNTAADSVPLAQLHGGAFKSFQVLGETTGPNGERQIQIRTEAGISVVTGAKLSTRFSRHFKPDAALARAVVGEDGVAKIPAAVPSASLSHAIHASADISLDPSAYDLSGFLSERGAAWGKVAQIIHGRATDDQGGVLLFVKTDKGRKCRVQTRMLPPAEKALSAQAPPDPATAAATSGENLAVTCMAAMNINRLQAHAGHSHTSTWYDEQFSQGKDHCLALVKPLLAKFPFPISAGDNWGKQAHHIRGLLITHLEPKAAQQQLPAQTQQTTMNNAQPTTAHFIELGQFSEAWNNSPALQQEFPDPPRGVYGRGSGVSTFIAWAGHAGRIRAAAEAGTIEAKYAERQASRASRSATPTQEQASAVDALIAAGKFEEAYAADETIRAEFPTKENYAAFMRHRHQARNLRK